MLSFFCFHFFVCFRTFTVACGVDGVQKSWVLFRSQGTGSQYEEKWLKGMLAFKERELCIRVKLTGCTKEK